MGRAAEIREELGAIDIELQRKRAEAFRATGGSRLFVVSRPGSEALLGRRRQLLQELQLLPQSDKET
jgi:hypothetical protein